jgi:hypothetical protein
VTYPTELLYEEVGYLAYHFHWPPDVILDLEHPERLRYLAQAARLATTRRGAL